MLGEYGIISVGRVRPEKGTDLFVEAMIEALPKLPKATAIIAGATKPKDISFRKKLEAREKPAAFRVADRTIKPTAQAQALRVHPRSMSRNESHHAQVQHKM